LITLLTACSQSDFDKPAAKRNLDDLMQHLTLPEDQDGGGLQNPVFDVIIPGEQFEYSFASGQALTWTEGPMTKDHQFHLASVGKTFTATLILQLSEEGRLGPDGLDTSLIQLEPFDEATLDRLLIVDGISYGREITVRQLLLHSSGLKDQYGDDANGTSEDYSGQLAPGGLLVQFLRDIPAHMECLQDASCDGSTLITRKNWQHWDSQQPDDPYAGMLNFYINQMGHGGLCAPGSCFQYSDIGYVILGLIAEKVSGKSLHGLLRERIFDPLALDKSYLAYGVDPDASSREVAMSDFDMGGIPAVSAGINLSFDWGGGGVVATAPELNKYFRALLEGRLFANPDTLAQMIDWQLIPGLEDDKSGIGLGLFRFKGPGGIDFWAKFGAWGAGMIFDPVTGAFIAGTQNGLYGPKTWSTQSVSALREASK
jgi:D-alanyl-D-alanine carboxypeptidase